MENRSLFGPAIDVHPGSGSQPVASLVAVLRGNTEFQVHLKHGAAYGLRLVSAAAPRIRPEMQLRKGTSLVTGGTKVDKPAFSQALPASSSHEDMLKLWHQASQRCQSLCMWLLPKM